MEEVIRLIMRRDEISYEEAKEAVDECVEEMWDAVIHNRFQEVEDILASELGLEPDYIPQLMGIC